MTWIRTAGGDWVRADVISEIVLLNTGAGVEITAYDVSGDWFHKLAQGLTHEQAYHVMDRLGPALAKPDPTIAFTGEGHIVDIRQMLGTS